MPLYEYLCDCGKTAALIQEMNDIHELRCECGRAMYQDWAGKGVRFGGELPATGGFAPFVDGETGLEITSQKMWDDVRKRTKRVQFEEDPEQKKARDEAVYGAKHADPGDHSAIVAGEKAMKAVHRKKTEARLEKQRAKVADKVLRDLSSVEIAEES